MNLKLDRKLCRDFPSVFADRNASRTMSAMANGFDCGDGWEPLIRVAAEKLADLSPFIKASQVKEKFGSLRFYLSEVPPEYDKEAWLTVEIAERASMVTCETCGEVGKLQQHMGWLYTSCAKHLKD